MTYQQPPTSRIPEGLLRLYLIDSIGSSGRIRTYNPSVNSRAAYSRHTLQTRDLRAPNADYRVNWGGFGGTRNVYFSVPQYSISALSSTRRGPHLPRTNISRLPFGPVL